MILTYKTSLGKFSNEVDFLRIPLVLAKFTHFPGWYSWKYPFRETGESGELQLNHVKEKHHHRAISQHSSFSLLWQNQLLWRLSQDLYLLVYLPIHFLIPLLILFHLHFYHPSRQPSSSQWPPLLSRPPLQTTHAFCLHTLIHLLIHLLVHQHLLHHPFHHLQTMSIILSHQSPETIPVTRVSNRRGCWVDLIL